MVQATALSLEFKVMVQKICLKYQLKWCIEPCNKMENVIRWVIAEMWPNFATECTKMKCTHNSFCQFRKTPNHSLNLTRTFKSVQGISDHAWSTITLFKIQSYRKLEVPRWL